MQAKKYEIFMPESLMLMLLDQKTVTPTGPESTSKQL